MHSFFAGKSVTHEPHIAFQTKGGLGNQLFQLACAINYSIQNDINIRIFHVDRARSSWMDLFGINKDYIYKAVIEDNSISLERRGCVAQSNFSRQQVYAESTFHYSPLPVLNGFIFDGYWQSEKYFLHTANEIATYFRKILVDTGSRLGTNTAVHVRLGDFLKNSHTRNYHGLVPEFHYLNSLALLGTNGFSVVTDDIDSAESLYPELLASSVEVFSGPVLKDFSFLVQANSLIIGNSTFSWWAARLSDALIIAPKCWFSEETMRTISMKDFYPSAWVVK